MAQQPYYSIALVCKHHSTTVNQLFCCGLRERPVGLNLVPRLLCQQKLMQIGMWHFTLIMFMRGPRKAVANISHAIAVDQQRSIDLVVPGLQILTVEGTSWTVLSPPIQILLVYNCNQQYTACFLQLGFKVVQLKLPCQHLQQKLCKVYVLLPSPRLCYDPMAVKVVPVWELTDTTETRHQ